MSSNGHPAVKIETFSVDQLKQLLERQKNPRKLNEKHTNRLARSFREGVFRSMNGQTIVLDEDDNLIDGQHRVNAAILANVPLRAIVVRGVAEGADSIDTGRRRSFADILGGRGWQQQNAYASTVAVLHHILRGNDPFSANAYNVERPSNSELLTTLGKLKRRTLEWAMKATPSNPRLFPQATLAAVLYQAHLASPKKAEDFVALAASGEGLKDGHPIFAMRRHFISGKCAKTREERRARYGVIVKAWNLFVTGSKSVSILRHLSGEALPVVEKP